MIQRVWDQSISFRSTLHLLCVLHSLRGLIYACPVKSTGRGVCSLARSRAVACHLVSSKSQMTNQVGLCAALHLRICLLMSSWLVKNHFGGKQPSEFMSLSTLYQIPNPFSSGSPFSFLTGRYKKQLLDSGSTLYFQRIIHYY